MSPRGTVVALASALALRAAAALRASAAADRDGSSAASGTCDSAVAFLFLTEGELPLAGVWRRFLDTCEPGSYTLHIHSQRNLSYAELPEASLVRDPMQGELRGRYGMVRAMNKLYHAAADATAPNGCQPRWAQMLSESCAPMRRCSDYQAYLGDHVGTSFFQMWECGPVATVANCDERRPAQWTATTTWYKASQWSTLWMEHARQLLARERENDAIFRRAFIPDEHYTINVLESMNATVVNHGLTGVIWSGARHVGGAGHPDSIGCEHNLKTLNFARSSARKYARDAVTHNRWFGRKFNASCAEALIENLRD